MKQYGVIYCSRACCHADPDRLAKIYRFIQSRRQTKLETAGYAMLDAEGVVYQSQHVMFDKWCVDAFMPAANLVIQFDGDYWHGNPVRFPVLTPKQDRQRRMDCGQDVYLTKRGHRILRIWEMDMKKHPEEVRQRLRAALAQPAQESPTPLR